MAGVSPVAVEVRGGGDGAEPRPVTHRTKHRKEVKRYHQRQLNKQLREEAKARDAQLFLFEHGANAAATEEAEAAAVAAEIGVVVPPKTLKPKEAARVPKMRDGNAIMTEVPLLPLEQPTVVGAPLPLLTHTNWGFDFVLRKPPSAVAPVTDAASRVDEEAPSELTATNTTTAAAASASLPPPPATTSLVAAPRRVARSVLTPQEYEGGESKPGGNSNLISVLEINSGVAPSSTKLLSNAQVQRVEGLSAIPMETPLAAGTDLNRPPRNYLTLDPIFNVHQHAPGFVRDQRVALQHMLATAMSNWKDLYQNSLIVTSAEAMRTIFEQVYVPSRPLALRVRRIGPTIIIDSRATQPSQVREMRQQALFSKALYLMKETHGRDTSAEEAATAAQMALALPERRLCGVAASDPSLFGANLHRYTQLLKWRIDSTELLVGNDAPVVLDHRTGTEQLVRVKAADQPDSTDAEQQETLRCWFDAMLANVPLVGTYFHCDGTLLSYQVKKTNELLGYVEARMAGAALTFTSTTLQWIVKHCQRDGATYAVFRDFATDLLRLYEIPDMDESTAFVAETEKFFSQSPAPAGASARAKAGSGGANSAAGGAAADASGGSYADYPSDAPHLSRFGLNFGRTCFNIGQHLFLEGGVARANDALALLHRSLRVFLPCCATEPVARETIVKVVEMLPALVSRKLRADASATTATAAAAAAVAAASQSADSAKAVGSNGGGAAAGAEVRGGAFGALPPEKTPAGFVTAACSSPELYREGLVMCGRFEIPLRRAFIEAGGADGDGLMQAFYARCLVASSAAVCTVVASSLDAYYSGCHHLRVMRKARSDAKARFGKATALRGADYREDVMLSIASMIQDSLQVVVEGLVRLEETCALISPLHAAEASAAATEEVTAASAIGGAAHRGGAGGGAKGTDAWAVPSAAHRAPSAVTSSTNGTTNAAARTAGSSGNNGAVTAVAKEELSSAGHSSSAASESVRSTTSSAHGEEETEQHRRTTSPARVAVAAAHRAGLAVDGGVKAASCGTVLDPRTQVDTTPLRSALCELYGDVVMIAMADTVSGFTTRTLTELGARLEARAAETSQHLPTTLLWLTALKADVVSLSFTALRFYGRVAAHTRRHRVKVAQVYYLVGKEHHRTARYTKALEALHRAKSLMQAAHKAPEDVQFGDAFGTHHMIQWADVMRLLGDVYRSVVERKLETALGVAVVTPAQPLLVGPLHYLPEDADTFFAQSINAYKLGGADDGCRTARACTLIVYASVMIERIAVSGKPATHAEVQRITDVLRESETLAPEHYVEEREWQQMRLFTTTSGTAADAALTRAVSDILLRAANWSRRSKREAVCSSDSCGPLEVNEELMWVDVDVADSGVPRRERMVVPPQCAMIEGAQKALACCVMAEHLVPPRAGDASTSPGSQPRSPPVLSETKYRGILRWIGKATSLMTSSINTVLSNKDVWRNAAVRHQWLSTLRTWGEHTVGGCLHHIFCLMALRVFGAVEGFLPPPKQQAMREAFKELTRRLEWAASLDHDSDDAYNCILTSLRELLALLTPFAEWEKTWRSA